MNRIKLILIAFVLIASISVASAAINVGGDITSDTTWYKTDTPHTVTSDVIVYDGATLTIEPGVTVNFEQGKRLQIGKIFSFMKLQSGKLDADGTSEKITFTGTVPTAGHWDGIVFTPVSDDASVINNTIIEYGGCEWRYNTKLRSANIITCFAAPTITNSTIRNSAGDGILCIGRSGLCDCKDPVIICNWITNNVNGVHTVGGFFEDMWANPRIYHNNICGNSEYGVLNTMYSWSRTDPSEVNATYNWWGAATGPTHPDNLMGTGDNVSYYVDYSGWTGSPVPCAPIPELSSIILVAAGLLMLAGCARIGRRD